MARQTVRITRDSEKSVEKMFAYLSDHNNLSKVFLIPVKRIKDGQDDVNGVGSVRKLGIGPVGVEETVVAVEPNKSIDYRITRGGGPIQNHKGNISFEKKGSGSRVTWTIEFDSPVPMAGSVIKMILGQGVEQGLKRVA